VVLVGVVNPGMDGLGAVQIEREQITPTLTAPYAVAVMRIVQVISARRLVKGAPVILCWRRKPLRPSNQKANGGFLTFFMGLWRKPSP